MSSTRQKCGLKCEIYSRVCGYFRPVAYWNKGKREEFKDRKNYNIALSKKNAPVL
jgi:anaerobic ribonucleoside-triphosphate reductase